jgi:N-acetylglucosaminyldiphosphoundecaprenol N-acetyl-beta-D-mannosaminyltransferase
VDTKKINLIGVGVDPLSREMLLDKVDEAIGGGGRLLIAHANLHGLNLAYEQPWLRDFYNRADLVYCDGMGVKLGARIVGGEIKERYTLADWIWELAGLAAEKGFRLFLLGNPPGVAEKAAQNLTRQYPTLQIAGVQHGYFEKSALSSENEGVVAEINRHQPDILLVGFGMPVQERWLDQNWPQLEAHVAITCGALFEYLSGDLKRGPRWMTDHYLEWLARLLISPRRYLGRYMRDLPLFFYRLTKQRLNGS